MSILQGIIRFIVAAIVVTVGFFLVLGASLIPFKIRRVNPGIWVVRRMTLMFARIFNVTVTVDDLETLQNHEGFIFLNHNSYLEAIMLFNLIPVRFLAAIEMAQRPLIGQMAKAVGTVFVSRANRESRSQARTQIEQAVTRAQYPAMVIFPEGKLGPGSKLMPFRRGGFEMAAKNQIAFLPVAVRFEPFEVAHWNGGAGETLLQALWKLATHRGEVKVHYTVLEAVHPKPNDDATTLALETEMTIARELGWDAEGYEDHMAIAA